MKNEWFEKLGIESNNVVRCEWDDHPENNDYPEDGELAAVGLAVALVGGILTFAAFVLFLI